VGRIALSVAAMPAILPVQFYLDGRKLAVCLEHRELPELSVSSTVVAFAADSIDATTRSGWSVSVQVTISGFGSTCARSLTRFWPLPSRCRSRFTGRLAMQSAPVLSRFLAHAPAKAAVGPFLTAVPSAFSGP
jgi:hypothetical protein